MITETLRGAACISVAAWLSVAGKASAGITIYGGFAYRSLDIGESATLNEPPATLVPYTHEGYDLLLTPNGRTDYSNGWSSASWDANAYGGVNGHFSGGGSSRQGFNGAHGETGWVYGRGAAEVSATFTLDQSYHYTATSTTKNVNGVHAGKGYMRAGTHTVSGKSVGNQPGFFFDMTLVPGALPTAEQLLKGSLKVEVDGAKIAAYFIPANGDTPEAAAEALGFKEFNILQTVTHVPSHWSLREVNSTDARNPFATGVPLAGPPYLDPAPQGKAYRIETPDLPRSYQDFRDDYPSPDTRPFYHSVGTELAKRYYYDSQKGARVFKFFDEPAFLKGSFRPGEYVEFTTRLVGVREDGSYVWFDNMETNIKWTTNAVFEATAEMITDGGVIGATSFKWGDESFFPYAIHSGGVLDFAITDVPEPTTGLGMLGTVFPLTRRIRASGTRRRGHIHPGIE